LGNLAPGYGEEGRDAFDAGPSWTTAGVVDTARVARGDGTEASTLPSFDWGSDWGKGELLPDCFAFLRASASAILRFISSIFLFMLSKLYMPLALEAGVPTVLGLDTA
jgi:hypothetical protein